VRSAPLGTPRTASRIRCFGCRRRAGARLLLAGASAIEDGLGIIHYFLIHAGAYFENYYVLAPSA